MSATRVSAVAGAILLASRNKPEGFGEMIVIAAVLYGVGYFVLALSNALLISIIGLVLGFS
jgi:hypothetical protein